ncbi:MAG TPA: hypothetical protein VFX49_16420 [Chloroflexota bacterium]|nr:hypothetical protein [Chloroflexota bacterium]
MNGWLRGLAVALAFLATYLVVRQVGIFGYRPFGDPADRPPGPPIPGSRGKLAYVRDGDIYTYDLRDGSERRVTRTGGARAPRWSGGGTWLAFEHDGRLAVVGADGSGLVDVPGGDLPASASWSTQGARLAYSSNDGSLSTYDPGARRDPRRILVPAGSGVGVGVVWSADAVRVAYERHQRTGGTGGTSGTSSEGIWTITELGRDPVPVFIGSGDVTLTVCCWTYSGTYVLFWQGSSATPDSASLLLARAVSSQPVQVAEAMLPLRSWVDTAPRSDGFAFVAGGARRATEAKRLVVGQPGTIAGNRLAVDTAVVEAAQAAASPAWAPLTGGPPSLAFAAGPTLADRGGDLAASLAGRRISLSRADGTEKRHLLAEATVPATVSDERPMWARDARTVLFARRLNPTVAVRLGGAPDALELWVAAADGSTSRRVVGGLDDPGPGVDGIVDWASVFDYHRG